MLAHDKPFFVGLVETHLVEGVVPPFHTETDYTIHRQDRDRVATARDGGGGILAVVRNQFPSVVVGSYQGPDFEALAVRVSFPRTRRPTASPPVTGPTGKDLRAPIVFIVMYSPPKGSPLTERGRTFLESTVSVDSILLGDLNFHPLKHTPPLHTLLRDELALKQYVGFPTRGDNTLDHVWSSAPLHCFPLVQLDDLSDHRAVAFEVQRLPPPSSPCRSVFRRRVWARAFCFERPPDDPPDSASMFQVLRVWDSWAQRVKEVWSRVVWVRPRPREHPWVTREVRRACRARILAFRALRAAQSGGLPDSDVDRLRTDLRCARHASRKACRAAQSSHARSGFLRRLSRAGALEVRELLGRSTSRAEPSVSPSEVRDFFSQKQSKLVDRFREVQLPPVVPISPVRTFAWTPPTREQVVSAVANVTPSPAMGVDELPMAIIKASGNWFVGWLVALVGCVIREAVWPQEWKQSVVLPVWKKKGDPSKVEFYRPISLLIAVSRLAEKVLAASLGEYLDSFFLPSAVHGARKHCSPRTALVAVLQFIVEARERGEFVAILTIDVEGAFDAVNHDRLVQKAVVQCGFPPHTAELLRSYLRGRSFRVRMSVGESEPIQVTVGVPQGSVLGPHLFVLYTADFAQALTRAALVAYVDDFTLLVSAKTVPDLHEKLRLTVVEVEKYMDSNALVIADKSELMLIGTDEKLEVTLRDTVVQSADSISVLKVIVDKGLTFLPFAKVTAASVTGTTRGIVVSFPSLRPSERAMLMREFAHPRIDHIWPVLFDFASAPARELIRRAYTRTARFAFTTRRIDHRPGGSSQEALDKLGWPTWDARLQAIRRAFVMAVWVTGRPHPLRALLPQDLPVPHGGCLSFRKRPELPLPQVSTALGRKGFATWGTEELNVVRRFPPPCVELPGAAACGPKPRHPFRPDEIDLLEFYAGLKCTFRNTTESFSEDRVVVWTDGSAFKCVERGTPGWRAGGGVFYGARSPKNAAVPVTGSRSAQRAEIEAFLHVLRQESNPFEVRTDSKYLVGGVQHLSKRMQRAWYSSPTMAQFAPNADLWCEIEWLLAQRPSGFCLVTKVKGHAKEADVVGGVVAPIDAWGNAGADWVAQWAARYQGGGVPEG